MSYVAQQYFKYGNGLQIANLICVGFDTTIILAIQNDPSTQLHKSVRFQTTHLVKLLLLSPKIHPQAAFSLASRPFAYGKWFPFPPIRTTKLTGHIRPVGTLKDAHCSVTNVQSLFRLARDGVKLVCVVCFPFIDRHTRRLCVRFSLVSTEVKVGNRSLCTPHTVLPQR